MSSIVLNKASSSLQLFVGRDDGVTVDFFIWLWFIEEIVKIKSIRESDKPWLNCELPRSVKYDSNKKSNFRRVLKRFYNLVMCNDYFEIRVNDDDPKKDISVYSKTKNFNLLRNSLIGIVEDIGDSVMTQLKMLQYGSFIKKDGRTAAMYGPLSLANNRCGSAISFGTISGNVKVFTDDNRTYSVQKLKATSLTDLNKPPKVYVCEEVLIRYGDGKDRNYVCNCEDHRRSKRLKSRELKSGWPFGPGHTMQVIKYIVCLTK